MLSTEQQLNNLTDFSDPLNPVLRTSGSGGGTGGAIEFVDLSDTPPTPTTVTADTTVNGKPIFSAVDNKRESAIFFNPNAARVFFSPASGVSASNYSFYLDQGQGQVLDRTDGLAKYRWFVFVASGTNDIQVTAGVAP